MGGRVHLPVLTDVSGGNPAGGSKGESPLESGAGSVAADESADDVDAEPVGPDDSDVASEFDVESGSA